MQEANDNSWLEQQLDAAEKAIADGAKVRDMLLLMYGMGCGRTMRVMRDRENEHDDVQGSG